MNRVGRAAGALGARGGAALARMGGAAGPGPGPAGYRACAGGLIFDRRGRLLVFERSDRPGQWQFPQGGLDEGEDDRAAAAREVWEETGLRAPTVTFVSTLRERLRYDVPPGTWLEKQGFRGQQMAWSLFFFEPDTDAPSQFCNLDGLGGEKPEFKAVRWASWAEVLESMAGFKRPVYERLSEISPLEMNKFLSDKNFGADG